MERLSGAFAQVVATLQQPLLSDVGIKCTSREGLQQLHRCRDQAARQFGAWSGGLPAPSRDMAALLGHVMQVEVGSGGRGAEVQTVLYAGQRRAAWGGGLRAGRGTVLLAATTVWWRLQPVRSMPRWSD